MSKYQVKHMDQRVGKRYEGANHVCRSDRMMLPHSGSYIAEEILLLAQYFVEPQVVWSIKDLKELDSFTKKYLFLNVPSL